VTEIETEVKKWGNSLGVRLPRDFLKEAGIVEGDRVHVHVEKSLMPNPEFFGFAKRFKKRSSITYEEFKAEEKKRERARERRLGLR